MSRRYAVLGLSVVFALALAVPALGGPSNPIASVSASVKQTANKALKKAKSAQNTANSALNAANAAQGSANSAQSDATKALTEAKKAQTTANTAQSSANTAQSSANAAKAAADAANANANTRVKESVQRASGLVEGTETPKFTSVSCLSGEPVLGGGYSIGGESNKVTVTTSEEQLYGGGWFVNASTISGQGTPNWSLLALVVCGTK
jgi:membrane protein involved in colicin uptake